ncbi:MAG TPA: dTMP kinase [Candidatus Paceibacterota bacterium]
MVGETMNGKYIVFEGCEGSGKDTQMEMLANVLQWGKKYFVAVTKEPGGTPAGKKFRAFLLNEERIPAIGEVFLFLNDRVLNVYSFVIPNLKAGRVVLQNRGPGSTFAYQQASGFKDINFLKQANTRAMQGVEIDLNILLDIDPRIGFQRKKENGIDINAFEARPIEYHDAVRRNYLEQAKADQEHWIVIDATPPDKDFIHKQILQIISEKLGL